MKRPTQEDGRVHGVIIGCQREDGRWLLIRRSDNVAAPGKICFPGGAVEVGENRDEAAVREMREELGVAVSITGPIWRHSFDDRPLTLHGYLGTLLSEELAPDPHEVAQALWLSEEEAKSHPDAMPMTDAFIKVLAETVARQG